MNKQIFTDGTARLLSFLKKTAMVLSLLGIWNCTAPLALATGPGYVILTTTNIVATSTKLPDLVSSCSSRGFDIVVVSNTPTAQGGWGGGIGTNAAENIRTWLRANYTNLQGEIVIDYLLLIGNPNPLTGDVPMKQCLPYNEITPTDAYYAELDANWNPDGDAYFGEWSEFTDGALAVRSYDIYVGRIPLFGSISDLDSIVSNAVAYANAPRSASSWRDKALLPGQPVDRGWLTPPSEGYILAECIKDESLIPAGWEYYRVYNTNANLSLPPEVVPCTASNVVAAWNSSRPGFVTWWQHGSQTEVQDITTGTVMLNVDYARSLSRTNWAFTFQGSCLNAHPETTNNLAYTLLLQGCVGTVGASRNSYQSALLVPYAYTIPGWNQHMCRGYASRLVVEELTSAAALADYKYDVSPSQDQRWVNYLVYNLYGCPDLSIRSVRFSGPLLSF